jgi:hypothetical protein
MPTAVKHTSTAALGRLSSVLSTSMPSDPHYPPGGISDINHPPITHNQLCISLPDPTLVTTELLTLHQVTHQRKQEEAVSLNYQPGTKATRFLAKIRSLCTISYGKHGSFFATCAPPARISLTDSTIGTTKVFTLPQVARQHKEKEPMNSNYRPGEAAMRYFTKVCTIASGKSTNCAQTSYDCLSDALETITTIHSISLLATTDADDTFITADELSVSL